MVEHKIRVLTGALSHIGPVNNTRLAHRPLDNAYSFLVTSANIAKNDISLKSRFFGLHFVTDNVGLSSATLT